LLAVFGTDDEDIMVVSILFSNLCCREEDCLWGDVDAGPFALLEVWVAWDELALFLATLDCTSLSVLI
jgi:hypothetical protein